MTWWQFSLNCQAAELEQVEDLMLTLGAISISLRDAGDEPLYEPLPGTSPVWQESVLTATFDGHLDQESLQQRLSSSLPQHLQSSLRRDSLQEQDWNQAYKQHFKPLQCAPDLWIVPSWLQAPDPSATIIRLDPGLAFGTGTHPTTALCLAWLAEQNLEDRQIIDYGCGSGILAIAACKLGAKQLLAVDIDPQALSASAANRQLNAIDSQQIQLCLPENMNPAPVDLVMANILAGPLIEFAARFADLVKPGGQIILSGILKSQLKEIQSSYRPFFELEAARQREDWICIGGTRLQADNV